MLKVFGILMALGLSACATLQKTPEAAVPGTEKQALQAYSRVLQTYVNDAGEVDFQALAKAPQDLETFVSYVAHKKFTDFSSKEALLAHHLNSYNALSMYTVLKKGIPETNAGFKKVQFFYLTKMEIGGQWLSLVNYEADFIRSLGEDRVHWALNCMAVSCPRLPRKPFQPETLNRDLQQLAVEFFNSEKNVQVHADNQTVQVSEILKFFPKDFVPAKAPSLIAYINLYRSSPIPLNSKLGYIPYDWTINSSTRHRH